MCFVGLTLFPIRVVTLITAVAGLAVVATISTVGHDSSQPMPPWRRLLVSPAKPLTRLILWSLGFWHIKVVRRPGSAPSGTARVLVAAPHYSLIDPFVMMCLEMPCAVSKKAVGDLPIVGTLARAAQTIFVDRKDKASKKAAADAIIERGQKGSAWPPVLIFAEGTCTNGTAMVTFKPGPFLPGAPVQPVVLRYHTGSGYAAAARGEVFSVSAATGDAELRMGLSMLQFYNTLEVTYLPEYCPTDVEIADKVLFANNVRKAMSTELDVPVTAHSYEDVWLAGKAARYGVDQSFEVASLTSLFNLSAEGVTSLLEVCARAPRALSSVAGHASVFPTEAARTHPIRPTDLGSPSPLLFFSPSLCSVPVFICSLGCCFSPSASTSWTSRAMACFRSKSSRWLST